MYRNHPIHEIKREQDLLFSDGFLKCRTCQDIKPVDVFRKNAGYSLGYTYICKDCDKKSRLTKICLDCGALCGEINKTDYCKKCFPNHNAEFRDYSSVTGENNHMWKGGRFKAKGYWRLSVKGGSIYEHIHIIETEIGRKLTRDECIHHIDMDKSNNDRNNLMLMTKSKHRQLHNLYGIYTANLIKSGAITLDEVISSTPVNGVIKKF